MAHEFVDVVYMKPRRACDAPHPKMTLAVRLATKSTWNGALFGRTTSAVGQPNPLCAFCSGLYASVRCSSCIAPPLK